MKYATFLLEGRERVGIVCYRDTRIIPFTDDIGMLDLIGNDLQRKTQPPIPLSDVKLLAPLPRPAGLPRAE